MTSSGAPPVQRRTGAVYSAMEAGRAAEAGTVDTAPVVEKTDTEDRAVEACKVYKVFDLEAKMVDVRAMSRAVKLAA